MIVNNYKLKSSRGSILKWLVLSTTAVILIAIGVLTPWAKRAFAPIRIPPPPKLPSPNGYDFYAEAVKLIRPQDIEKIRNAYSIKKPWQPEMGPKPKGWHVYTVAEKEALLSSNSAALAKLRKGMKHPCVIPPDVLIFGGTGGPPMHFKRLGYLFLVEAQIKAAHDDWLGSANSLLDSFQYGRSLSKGGGDIGLMIARGIQSTALAELAGVIGKLDPKEARLAANRLADIMSKNISLDDSMEEEKWKVVEWANVNINKNAYFRWQINSYICYTDKCIVRERHKWPDRGRRIEEPKKIRMLFDTFGSRRNGERFRCLRLDAQAAFMELVLALKTYKSEHNKYPIKLDELVPDYLKKLPDDPFTENGSMRYLFSGDKYVLYSVGPDCVDDGGVPVYDKTVRSSLRRYVNYYCTGDWVYGVNE